MLSDEEEKMCSMAGEALVEFCFTTVDDGSKFYNVTKLLTDNQRERLLEKIFCFRIYFADSECRKILDRTRYAILSKSFQENLKQRWNKYNQLESYILGFEFVDSAEEPFDDLFDDLLKDALISDDFKNTSNYNDSKSWFMFELLQLKMIIKEATNFVNLSYEEWIARIAKNSNKPKFKKSNKKFDLFTNLKKTWFLIFCIVSLISCAFYTPYDYILQNGKFAGKITVSTIFSPPKSNRIRIDYETIFIRELIILIGCSAGYTVNTMIKKN